MSPSVYFYTREDSTALGHSLPPFLVRIAKDLPILSEAVAQAYRFFLPILLKQMIFHHTSIIFHPFLKHNIVSCCLIV